MYLPTDPTLVTAVVIAKDHETRGDKTMMKSWAILAHNYAVRNGYYAPESHAQEIDWEEWAARQTS